MQIQPRQLNSSLKKSLKPVYFIHGDEPLLSQECFDTIIDAAKQQGFTDRKRLDVEPGFDWQQLVREAESLSLFADKTILHLQNPDAKFDDQASKALIRYFEIMPSDKLLIITSCRIPNNRQTTKWFKAIDKQGATIPVFPQTGEALLQFLKERCEKAKLNITPEAIALLATLTEGNLLAAQQTITKLSLLNPEATIDETLMARMLGDAAKYTVFDLGTQTLLGNTQQATRILQSLKETGTELVLVLWALQRDLAAIIALKQSGQTPHSPSYSTDAIGKQATSKRLNAIQLKQAIKLAADCDLIIKGLKTGDPWSALLMLCLTLCGTRLPKVML